MLGTKETFHMFFSVECICANAENGERKRYQKNGNFHTLSECKRIEQILLPIQLSTTEAAALFNDSFISPNRN